MNRRTATNKVPLATYSKGTKEQRARQLVKRRLLPTRTGGGMAQESDGRVGDGLAIG